MKSAKIKVIFTLALLLMPSTMLFAQEKAPSLVTRIERNKIYEGESVRYQVTLKNVADKVKPDMSAFTDFKVKSLGTQQIGQSYFSVTVNGRSVTNVNNMDTIYVYELTPLKSGTMTVPSPTVTLAGGETLTGHPVTLEVRPPGEQDLVKMYITATPLSVYPTQEFEVTLAIAVKAMPGELAERDPLYYLRRQLPRLTIPWCHDGQLPEGLKPQKSTQRWLTDMQSHTGIGFSINDVKARSRTGFMFDMMDEQLATFEATPKRVTLPDAQGKDTTYWFYEFPRRFVPDRPGEFTFGPATLKGTFVTGVSEDGKLSGESVFVSAKPVTMTVNDVPTEDRPASYCGAVGKIDHWTATFNPTQTRVDSPVTLTLTLAGTGSLANVKPLDLARIPAVAENFKTYDGTRQDERDAVKLVYTLRPKSEKITEFPAIPLSYFDVETGQYETIRTRPIPIEVGPAEKLSSSQIVGAGGLPNRNHELQVSAEGVFANVTDPADIYDQTPRPELWFGTLGGLVVLYIVLALMTRRYRQLHEDPERLRRRSAVGNAKARLAEGRKLLGAGQTARGAEEVHAALAGLVAAAAGLPSSGMTTADACRKLKEFGADAQLVDDLRDLFETCDATRYGGADATLHGQIDKLDSLFGQTVSTLKRQKRLR